jgi:hypothetical protein
MNTTWYEEAQREENTFMLSSCTAIYKVALNRNLREIPLSRRHWWDESRGEGRHVVLQISLGVLL